MKIWNGYGSEHSMNLVMIGSFKEVKSAAEAKQVLDKLTEQVETERETILGISAAADLRFSETMLKLLQENEVYVLSPAELEQFLFEVDTSQSGKQVIVRTDETEVSSFIKILVGKGAKLEVFSAHEYPEGEE